MQNLEKGFTKKKSHYIFVKHDKFDAEKNGVLWNLIEKDVSCGKSLQRIYIYKLHEKLPSEQWSGHYDLTL